MYIPFGSCLLSYASDWGQLTRQINKISQSYKAPLCDHIQKVLIEVTLVLDGLSKKQL